MTATVRRTKRVGALTNGEVVRLQDNTQARITSVSKQRAHPGKVLVVYRCLDGHWQNEVGDQLVDENAKVMI